MSEQPHSKLNDSLRLFADIARFRKGPEDVPVSGTLLGTVVLADAILSGLSMALLPTQLEGSPALIIGLSIAITLLYLKLVLALARHPERFTQTATAIFGYQIVMMPAILATGWLFLTAGQNPSWQAPVIMLRLVVEVWALAVAARILRAATGWPMAACVALAIAGELLTYLALAPFVPQLDPAAAPAPAAPV